MLASDVNNPEYVGSRNPDDALFVEFYMHEPEDWNKSLELGKKVRGQPMPYVRIQAPGDKTTIIETPVREDHKQRWPQKWLYFQMKEGLVGGDQQLPGWAIDDWDYLDDEQKRELKYQRYSIVEQLAGASDAQVQRLGMGGVALREAAKRALREKMGAEAREMMEQKDREIAQLRLADQQKEERLKKLEELLLTQPNVEEKPVVTAEPVPAPKKRGRPRKTELAVVEGHVNG